MIVGIGTDVAEVERLEALLSKRYADRFVQRIFTEREHALCRSRRHSAASYAARWALKEAFYKALPAALQPLSSWHSIELAGTVAGKPSLVVCCPRLRAALEEAGITGIHHSISHERSVAIAYVVLESL